MKIKKGFVLERVGDSYLACATGKLAREFSGFVRLNETGAFLWNQLAGGDMAEQELITALTAEYDVSADIAAKDVATFVANLLKNGIVE